jgi:hypothetical protein
MRTHFCSFKGLILQLTAIFRCAEFATTNFKMSHISFACLSIFSHVTTLKPLNGFNVNLTQKSLAIFCRRNVVLVRFELKQWALYLTTYMRFCKHLEFRNFYILSNNQQWSFKRTQKLPEYPILDNYTKLHSTYICSDPLHKWTLSSLLDIVTGLRAGHVGNQSLILSKGKRSVLYKTSRPVLGPTQLLFSGYRG